MPTTSHSNLNVNSMQGCHGGVFVYKDDNRVEDAWRAVEAINEKQIVCGELHKNRSDFLAGLCDWNTRLEDDNAYLIIYAHMGTLGINCYGRDDATKQQKQTARILWPEIADCLPRQVEMIWLLGCKSKAVLEVWKESQPAKYLLVTSESKNYVGFVPQFAAEISLNPITPYNQMANYLEKHNSELAKHTAYYRATKEGYVEGFVSEK